MEETMEISGFLAWCWFCDCAVVHAPIADTILSYGCLPPSRAHLLAVAHLRRTVLRDHEDVIDGILSWLDGQARLPLYQFMLELAEWEHSVAC